MVRTRNLPYPSRFPQVAAQNKKKKREIAHLNVKFIGGRLNFLLVNK